MMVWYIYVVEYCKGQHSSLKHLVQILLKKGKLYTQQIWGKRIITLSKNEREDDMVKIIFLS